MHTYLQIRDVGQHVFFYIHSELYSVDDSNNFGRIYFFWLTKQE